MKTAERTLQVLDHFFKKTAGLFQCAITFLLLLGTTDNSLAQNEMLSGQGMISQAISSQIKLLQSSKTQPAKYWAKNPMFLPVHIAGTNIYGVASSSVTVTIKDAAETQTGGTTQVLGADTPTNSAPFTFSFKARKEYTLIVEATGLTSLDLTFAYQPNWTPLSPSGKNLKPKEYRIYVDRELNPENKIVISGAGGGTYSNAWTVELTEDLPAQWRLEDGSDDPEPAPGDGVWAQLGPGKSLQTNQTAFSWSVGLGRLMDGLAGGRLTIRETGISRASYTSAVLYYTVGSSVLRDEVELVPQSIVNPVLRQVKAYQTFVDIVSPSTNETQMKFYLPSQVGMQTNSSGYYTNITGDPFVVWALVNPDPATTNKLNIVERRNGVNSTNEIIFDSASTNATWTLKYGKGAEQRVETRGVTFSYSPNTNRFETVDVRYAGAGASAYLVKETYRQYPWGFELVETRIDPDNDPGTDNDLVTSIAFYDNPMDTNSYGKGFTTVNPDGSWEKRIYEFGIYEEVPIAILRPFFDSPASPSSADESNSVISQYFIRWARQVTTAFPPYSFEGSDYILGTNVLRSEAQDNLSNFSAGDIYFVDHSYNYFVNNLTFQATGIMKGKERLVANEMMGFGLAKHPLMTKSTSGNSDEISYYNSVTYNPTYHSYLVHTNSDYWSGPDWRSATIYAGADFSGLNGDTIVQTLKANGELLVDSSGDYQFLCSQLTVNKSLQDSYVYHAGSPILREKHIFTGGPDNHLGDPLIDVSEAEFELVCSWNYQNDSLGHATNITWVDGVTGMSRVTYTADYRGTNAFDGELKLWDTDEQGIKTYYTYDSLKRIISTRKEGVAASGNFASQSDIVTTSVYDAFNRKTGETNSAASISLSSSTEYDLSGRIISQTDTNALTTTFVYELGGRKVTKTLPNGATYIEEKYLDGHLKSITGTGVVNEFHDWDTHGWNFFPEGEDLAFGLPLREIIHFGSTLSERVKFNWYDRADRIALSQKFDMASTNLISEYQKYSLYGRGDLLAGIYSVFPDGQMRMQKFAYDHMAAITNGYLLFNSSVDSIWGGDYYSQNSFYSGLRAINPSGNERASTIRYCLIKTNGHWFQATTNMIYRTEYDATPTVTGITLERLNGFTNGNILSEIKMWDVDTNLTVQTTAVDRSTKKITQITDVPYSTLNATNITINGLLQSENTFSVGTPTWHYYDALGRETKVTSPLGFSATIIYDTHGYVQSMTDVTGKTTVYDYYPNAVTGAGQLKSMEVNGKKTYHSYTLRGEPYRTWGDVPYPEERVYSDFGELVELHTYRGGSGWNSATWPGGAGTADVTTWTYDEPSGMLLSKTDNSAQSVSYNYTNGMIFTRTWARGVTVTNNYNGFNDLISMDYNDGTPSVYYTNFSRTGLPQQIIDGTGTNSLTYDHADRLVSVEGEEGLYNGITVNNHFNPVYGRDILRVSGLSTNLTNLFVYDAYGRMGSVTNGTNSATYTYLPNSDLLQNTAFKNGSTSVMTTSRQWDYGSRLRNIVNTVGSTNITAHNYLYDELNRRRQATLEDGSLWKYDYNDRDELISGKRYWQDWTPVAGQQFEYQFDTIGNRITAKEGGDEHGENLRTETYTANGLNQYSSRTVPDKIDVLGMAYATSTVTVNGNATYRKGEYYDYLLSVTNSTYPAWHGVTNKAVLGANSDSLTNYALVPPATQTLQYDLDGNLTNDAVWVYSYDGENRLIQMTNVSSLPAVARKKLVFGYDFMSRRSTKTVYSWGTTNWNPSADVELKFVYDGWNLIAEANATNNVLRSYTWGQDLSGEVNEAGGIGGLLITSTYGGSTTNCFVGYDGNGNITVAINAANKSTTARYEYNPFGETIRMTGLFSKDNPFRFSTKFADNETDLIYYGYRYYNASVGEWINRDPIEEKGGINLYAFVGNNPINAIDPFGQTAGTAADTDAAVSGGVGGQTGSSQSISYLNKLRDAYDAFNDFQELVFNMWDMMDTMGISNADDFLVDALSKGNQAFGSDLKSAGKKYEVHHVGTNKHRTKWTQAIGSLFSAFGIELDDELNLIPVPDHKGRHKDTYHKEVFTRLSDAMKKGGSFKQMRKNFLRELIDIRKDLISKPGMLK